MTTQPNVDELIAALLKVADQEEELQSLLHENGATITPQFWRMLINKAAAAYHFQGAEPTFRLFKIALTVALSLKDESLIANTHYQAGMTYSLFGKSSEAIRLLLDSQKHFTNAGRKRDLIYVLSDLGALYFYQNEFAQAQSYSEQALALAEGLHESDAPAGYLPDAYGVAGANSTLGALCKREGNYAQAITYLQRAIGLYQGMEFGKQKYAYQIADNLAEIGRVHRAMGDNVQALLFFQQALETAGKPHLILTASILNSLGLLYLEQEDYAQAISYFNRSLAAYESSRNQSGAALALLNLGVTFQRQEQYERAIDHFIKSIALADEMDKDVVIAAKQGLGAVYRAKLEFQSSLTVLNEGLLLAERLGDQTRLAELLWRKAETQFDLRNFDEAVALSANAREMARRLQLPKLSYLTATMLGKAYLAQNRIEPAVAALTEAIEQIETMRIQVAGQEQSRQLFFEKTVEPYHLLIRILIGQGKLTEAMQYAERAKARVLMELLNNGRWRPAKWMTPSEKAEDAALNEQIARLNTELRKEQLPSTAMQQISGRLEAARLKYASFQDLLYAKYAKQNSLPAKPYVLHQTEMEGLIADPKTALLNYVVTSDDVYLFLLLLSTSQHPALSVHRLSIGETELRKKVMQYRSLLANRHGNYATLANELYQLLVQPVEAQLQGIRTVGIIADGVLWELPFQALQTKTDHFLMEDVAIFYAPSLGVLKELKTRKADKAQATSLLAFANPTSAVAPSTPAIRATGTAAALPEAEAEVKAIQQLFRKAQSTVFVGTEAGEKNFKTQAAYHRIIHLATHGTLDNQQPLYSHLLFSKSGSDEDGLLEAREVLDLSLNADLVVLSACETARGKISAGEGMIGLSWAFLAAGSRTTVVSQWKVSSASTAEWMTHFYQQLFSTNSAGKVTKAAALRAAMLTLHKDNRYAHPFYWAGFVLLGDNE